jgi:V8-like Glu-specific endopeptidase
MRSSRSQIGPIAAAIVLAGLGSAATAQTAPWLYHEAPVRIDSGWVANLGTEPAVVFVTEVSAANAPWLRLAFDAAVLSGEPGVDGSYFRITSSFDGAQQILDGRTVGQWENTSAYFNGDAVVLELVAQPNTGPSRVIMSTVTAGDGEALLWDTICGNTDDRLPSTDPRQGRLSTGCTAWLYNDPAGCGNSFGTAGHCISNNTNGAVVEFNVPFSNSNGSKNHPPPEDQYPVERASIQSNGGQGVGNDYAIFRTFANATTGLTPFQAMGDKYNLASTAASVRSGDPIRITGYGTVRSPISPTWNTVQKTHVGPFDPAATGTRLRYRTDTSGGNSGSPVVDENSGNVIGVHTHGGCTSTGGSNTGTAIQHSGWQNVISNPRGGCLVGCACACDFDTSSGNGVCDIFDFLAFQNGFVGADPCSCDKDTSTGSGVCDIFDFLAFQSEFVSGCP